MNTKTILILSHNFLYAESLKSLLHFTNTENQYISSTFSQINFVSNISMTEPNIIIVDFAIINKETLKLLDELKNNFREIQFLVLLTNVEYKFTRELKMIGIESYVFKSSPKEILFAALKIVENGNKYYDSLNSGGDDFNVSIAEKSTSVLSMREFEITTLIKEGLSTKDIADKLNLSFHTIETHRKNIYNKLGINKVADLIRIVN